MTAWDLICRLWRTTLKREPDSAVLERAYELAEAGHVHQAKSLCEALLKQRPDEPRALHLLGVLSVQTGDIVAARDFLERAVSVSPDVAIYRFNLGNALLAGGNRSGALNAFSVACMLDPTHAPTRFNLGKLLLEMEDFDEAILQFGELCALWPKDAVGYTELAFARYRKACSTQLHSDYQAAAETCTSVQEMQNLSSDQTHNLALFMGSSLAACKRYREALAQFRRILQDRPDDREALVKIASCQSELGNVEEAIAGFEKIEHLEAENLPALSMIICAMDYLPRFDARANTERRFALMRRLKAPKCRSEWSNSPEPERRLRVGYVSPDLRTHVAMVLFEGVLRSHDRSRFEWIVYDATSDRDEKSSELRAMIPLWREIDCQKPEDLPDMVEADQIDVLVDLAGHTANNRLASFAYKPAPVQASWLAYPGSTGLVEIDYLISDRYTSPPHFDHHAAEQVWRLPHTRFCYQPSLALATHLPPIGQPITFACFNNINKLNANVFSLWSEILRQLPTARLVIKSFGIDDADKRAELVREMETSGIPMDRIELIGASSYLENFASYNKVHIALDPFPFCGGLTSLDALWMGVPVVTLEQELMAGRQTLAFLQNIGHTELIARTPEEYVRIAVELALKPDRIAAYRDGLREAMRNSPLLDPVSLTRNLEDAYRNMWRRWCERRNQAARENREASSA